VAEGNVRNERGEEGSFLLPRELWPPCILNSWEEGERIPMRQGRERESARMDRSKGIRHLIEGRVLLNAPMKEFTSIKVGGPADALFFPKNVDELRRVVQAARKKSVPTMIVGKGTNLIVTDRGFRGWMINLTQGMKRFLVENEVAEAEAGLSLQRLVQSSVRKGLTGLEPFFGIPGTVGGGLAMNAGAWGGELKDIVLSLTFMNEAGEIVERPRSKLKFSYRALDFSPLWIILKGRFQLKRGNKKEVLERVKTYSEMRKRSQPLEYPSAGSIFKNPEEGPAGKWIEEAGMKGFRVGQAMVSEQHANFIVNLGKARAEEIIRLIERVEKKVYEDKGISLEREVKVVGE
jgi:UDP-N-acetylmuramate dehydrogenase